MSGVILWLFLFVELLIRNISCHERQAQFQFSRGLFSYSIQSLILPFFCRYIVQVVDEEGVGEGTAAAGSDLTTSIEAQDVRYVQLPHGESAIQISIGGNTTLMLPCNSKT